MADKPEDKKRAQQEKEKGNKAFKKGNHALAIKHFTQAITLSPSDKTLYSNRSAAYAASAKHDKRKFDDAVQDALKVVQLDPDWGKGYARHANVLFLQGKYEEAVKIYAVGIGKDPSNKSLMQGLQAAQKKIAKSGGKSEQKNDGPSASTSSPPPADGEYAIGIDLGTTNSCVAVWKGQGVEIIQNNLGDRTTPSFVSWTASGDRLVGQPAKNLTTSNPKNTVYDIKRIIGQRFDAQGVDQDVRKFAFTVEKGVDDRPVAVVEAGEGNVKRFAPEEISAMVLQNLKQTAEAYLGRKVTQAVVTVPAYFNDAQRNATKAAGKIAGLDVLRIINEPTAAALAYGLDSDSDKPSNVLIFDLGGGTFDVSLLHITGGLFEVKATGGDTRLGGEDFDHSVSEFLIKEAERQGFKDLHENRRAVRRLNLAAERAKRILSSSQSAEIDVESLSDGKDFALTLRRARFEQINRATFLRCLETVQRVLKDAKLKAGDVDEVVLVGGSTRIPKLQQMLQEHFGGKELCKSVNPDEAVAYGAAVQAAILTGLKNDATKDLLLMDVTPLSLGIETVGRVMSVIIPRNTHIPCVRKQIYTTEEDYQTAIDVCVFEGERSKTEYNNLLGKFTITGIQRAKKHEPQIEVRFELDADGILKVTATDLVTNAKADIVVENRQSTNSDEVERMIKDAERFKARDDELIRRAEAGNSLQAVIYKVHEAAQEKASAMSQKLRATLRQAAAQAQDWLDDNAESAPAEEIERRCRNLERRIHARSSADGA